MLRIFRPNAYFEEEIQQEKLFPDWLISRNSLIESSFLVLSGLKKTAERTFLYNLPEKRWFTFWQERGLFLKPHLLLPQQLMEKTIRNEYQEIEEWGQISRWEPGTGFVIDPKLLANSKKLSSKLHQNVWRKEIGNEEFFSFHISKLEDWNLLSQQESKLLQSYDKFILKPEFGFAGNSRLCYGKDLHLIVPDHLGRWKEGFILEPWVPRTKDFSLLFSSENGTIRLDGGTVLLSDPKGKYAGTWIGKFGEIENYLSIMDKILPSASSFSENYTGFATIDSFFFQDGSTETLRKVSEINFRWTMGRLVWELRKEFPKTGYADLLLFFPQVSVPNAYEQLSKWEKESGWEIHPLSAFYSPQGKPMGRNLLWIRMPEKSVPDPWNDSKSAFEWGLRYLNA